MAASPSMLFFPLAEPHPSWESERWSLCGSPYHLVTLELMLILRFLEPCFPLLQNDGNVIGLL